MRCECDCDATRSKCTGQARYWVERYPTLALMSTRRDGVRLHICENCKSIYDKVIRDYSQFEPMTQKALAAYSQPARSGQ